MKKLKCLLCDSLIEDKNIKERTVEYWRCPKCKRKNYNYTSWGYTAIGGHTKKFMIRKESRDLRGNKSIIQREKDGWTHEVIDDEGKTIHEKHTK